MSRNEQPFADRGPTFTLQAAKSDCEPKLYNAAWGMNVCFYESELLLDLPSEEQISGQA